MSLLRIRPAYIYGWSYPATGGLIPTDLFTFVPDSLTSKYPRVCDEHIVNGRSVCFKAESVWSDLFPEVYGHWDMQNPIPVSSIMKEGGRNPKITTLKAEGIYWLDKAIGWTGRAYIAIVADGVEIWKKEIYHDLGGSRVNTWENLNIDLSGKNNFSIRVYQDVYTPTGYVAFHTGWISISGTYEHEQPPAKCTVEVTVLNQETNKPVPQATVRLIMGSIVKAQAVTDDNGIAVMNNVDEGSYSITITKSGFEIFKQSITVSPPMVTETFYLVPALKPPLIQLEWWQWAIIGVAGVGTLWFLLSRRGYVPSPVVVVSGAYEKVKEKVQER